MLARSRCEREIIWSLTEQRPKQAGQNSVAVSIAKAVGAMGRPDPPNFPDDRVNVSARFYQPPRRKHALVRVELLGETDL